MASRYLRFTAFNYGVTARAVTVKIIPTASIAVAAAAAASAPNESSRVELYVNSIRLELNRVESSRVKIIKNINLTRFESSWPIKPNRVESN